MVSLLRSRVKGFTVVELLIVIVVIAILATIGIISYTSVQRQALNNVRLKELNNWIELFDLYKNKYGHYPGYAEADRGVCLGEGFPAAEDDGKLRCREVHDNPGYSYLEEDNTALMAQFKAFTDIPASDKRAAGAYKWLAGPWAELRYNQYGDLNISTAIDSRNPEDCTRAGFRSAWTSDDGAMICTTQNMYYD